MLMGPLYADGFDSCYVSGPRFVSWIPVSLHFSQHSSHMLYGLVSEKDVVAMPIPGNGCWSCCVRLCLRACRHMSRGQGTQSKGLGESDGLGGLNQSL
jgi:hypothetical protein